MYALSQFVYVLMQYEMILLERFYDVQCCALIVIDTQYVNSLLLLYSTFKPTEILHEKTGVLCSSIINHEYAFDYFLIKQFK